MSHPGHRGTRPRPPWSHVAVTRRLLIVALVVTAVAVTTLVVVDRVRGAEGPNVAPLAQVTASSSAGRASPRAVVAGTEGGPWRSAGETVGAWIALAWDDPQLVRRVVLTRPPGEPGATEGLLSFGDGSQQQFTLSTTSPTTVVPFGSRSVDQLRITFSGVAPGATAVALDRVVVATDPTLEDVASGVDGTASAAAAEITAQAGIGGSDPAALADGTATGPGATWTATDPVGRSVTLTWERPRELVALEIVGAAAPGSRLRSGTITFSDGARLPLGAVLPEPTRPTTVAFLPRATRSVTLTIDTLDGAGPLALSELRVHERGSTPPREPSGVGPVSGPAPAGCVAGAPGTGPETRLAVACPPSDSLAGESSTLRITAPGADAVTARVWPADLAAPLPPPVRAVPTAAGTAELTVDLREVPPGPFTVAVEAGTPGTTTEPPEQVFVQLYRPGRQEAASPASEPSAGRTLVYAEEFDRPVSLSPEGAGADYASAKPTDSGSESFGEAPFADPALGLGNVGVTEGMLRLGVQPAPPDQEGSPDGEPAFVGGMLASARTGGSGFSAQYGYFEARMLAPAAPGTWPAFWLLPADNLVEPTPVVAEIDAVELYGHEPTGSCHSTHEFRDGDDFGVGRCDGRRFLTERDALAWHTYGVAVTPTENVFFIDGRVVATAPQVLGGDAPLFFLADLALGGGWPVELGGVGNRAALYVDHIRVYV